MTKVSRIHFMGVGGSAISGVALMSQKEGYVVSGCNLDEDTDYLEKVKKSVADIFIGHDKVHLKNVDLLVVSPSVLFRNKNHPEVVDAKKRKILMTWEEFLGKYLHKEKRVICIAGTHGKSTTTAMMGLMFEKANFDPSVTIGAKVAEWGGNYRIGKGIFFISEADEFFDNFLNYSSEAVVLNNIEFDHPDFFNSEDDIVASYLKFVKLLRGPKKLIINQDSQGIEKLFLLLPKSFLETVDVYGYTFKDNPLVRLQNSVRISIVKKDERETIFSLDSRNMKLNDIYHLKIPGEHNVANATGVILLSKLYGLPDSVVKKVLKEFKGVGRRMELIGRKHGISVYDDYAHHPTAIIETLKALRQKFPTQRLWVIVEPHSFSRTKALLKQYSGVFDNSDKVIIGPIFKARDTKTFGVTGQSIVDVANHKDILYLPSFEKILSFVKKNVNKNDVIIVMGAGKSYQLSRSFLKEL